MRTTIKKSISVLLTLVMLLSVFAGLHVLPAAQAVGNGKALQLTGSGEAANISGAQKSAVYFGNYKQSGSKETGYNVDPVKWRVLSNADGKLFLLADQNLDVFFYHERYRPTAWETCDMRKWLNDLAPYNDYVTVNFMSSAFAPDELAAVLTTDLQTDGSNPTQDKVFLLSVDDARNAAYGFSDNASRLSTNTKFVEGGGAIRQFMHEAGTADYWWLRTQGAVDDRAADVNDVGYLDTYGYDVYNNGLAVRPAFNLDLSKVLFTSAAAGGKAGDGVLTQIADYSGSEWKLTLLDDARAFAVTETQAAALPGETVTLTYAGASVGTNEYVSAILADKTGSAVCYGRLTQPDAADGTLTFTVPADLAPGTYTLKVFSEQYNGDKKTDFASAFCDVALTVRPGNNGKALQLTWSGEAANLYGAQQSGVYFGNYKQNGGGKDPVKWRVLSNAEGKLFLLADQNLDVVRYNESYKPVTWETCTLRKWLNNYDGHPYDDSFIGAAFSDKETAAIAETAVVNDDNPDPSYGTPGGSDTTDKVFLLSIAEATNTAYGFTDNYDDTDSRVSRNTAYVASGGHTRDYMYAVGEADLWWLRSPGFSDFYSSVVNSDGYLNDVGRSVDSSSAAVRPAFNLNLNSVLFTSAAAGGKAGDGALTKIADNDPANKDWKLTLLDDTRAFAVTETAANVTPGDTVTLTYSGATVGTNEYISAILADETGAAVYYGRLAQPDAADGTLTVTVPADLALGSYTLKVFSEQYNGDQQTDYASAFCDVTLTTPTQAELDQAAADAVEELIAAIGTPVYTPECDAKISAARTAYDRLTAAGKALVTNYADLTEAETDFAALQAQNDTGKALQLKTNGLAANLYGAQQSNIWFGKYKQSGNKTDGFNEDPVKWRVLSNADGRLFLLSDQNLDVVRYNEEETAVTWETCTLRKWLNGYDGNPHSDSFIVSAISDKEAAAIAETKVANDNNPSYNIPGGNDTTDKVFLVSIAEATNTAYGFTDNIDSTITRVSTNTEYVHSGGHTGGIMFEAGKADMWRLRTPGEKAVRASHVNTDGFLNDNGFSVFDRSTAVRPALNVDLNAVLFTSAAVNGKVGDGALTEIADNDLANKDWKLTLLDDTRAFAVTETAATAVSGGSVTLTYTGATTGDNEYVSVILADADGSAVYYGRLSQPEASGGAITVNLPALAAGSYTLKVFSEQYNGDYKTDYASAFSDVALTVISELDAAKAAAKAELENYKDPADYRADEQTDLAAAITAGNAAIDAAADIDAVNAALTAAKATIDAIKTDAQLTAEELAADKAAFEEYKEAVKTLADGMKLEGDSDACATLIEAAKEAVDAQTYDESKTLDENKEALDDAAALTQLAADLAAQRAAEADDPREAFEAYRETLLTLAEALRHDGDSAAVTALIDEATAALTDFAYDGAKTLAENEEAIGGLLSAYADAVRSQRRAERQEALKHQPCSLCGKHHVGSLLENLIGIFHGLIWIMRSIVLIAA